MRARRRVALVLVACALAAGGVIAAFFTNDVHESSASAPTTAIAPTNAAAAVSTAQPTTTAVPKPAPVVTTGVAPTTGDWTPITVKRPKVPVIAGGIPVDVDPTTSRSDFSTTLFRLGPNRYRTDDLQHLDARCNRLAPVVSADRGARRQVAREHCRPLHAYRTRGFGGNQFPGLVLYPNILCEKLDLNAASCICRGDGGAVAISFVTNKVVPVDGGDLRLRAARLAFERIPVSPAAVAQRAAHQADRHRVRWPRRPQRQPNEKPHKPPWTHCRTRTSRSSSRRSPLAGPRTSRRRAGSASSSRNPDTFKVYVFWVPWLAAEPYIWLNMDLRNDPARHVLARDDPAGPPRRQADQERTNGESTIGRHHVARAVRAGTGQERPPDSGRPRRRRARAAGCNMSRCSRTGASGCFQPEPGFGARRATLRRDEPGSQPWPPGGFPRPGGRTGLCVGGRFGRGRRRLARS